MLNRDPLFQALLPQLISSGLQPDLQELRQLLWTAGENVRFYAGKVVRNTPSALVSLPEVGFTPRGLGQQQAANGVRWLWMAGLEKVYRWYGPAAELIYTFPTAGIVNQTSTTVPTFVDFVPWGDWMVMNNGVDQVRLYKPGFGTSAISDAPAAASQYIKKFNLLMALGTGLRGTEVAWSDSDDIETWTPTATNLAGALAIDDFDTRIKCGVRLGQAISIFCEDQMGLVYPTNDALVFGQRTVLDGIGAIGKRSVVSDGLTVTGVGRNGVWWTDGNSARYIDLGYLHDYLQENVNWDQGAKINAARNDLTGCIDFHFPTGASTVCNEGWSFDPSSGGWSKIPAVAVQDERRIFKSPLQGHDTTAAPFIKGEFRLMADNAALELPLSLVTKPLLMQLRAQDGMVDCHTDTFVQEVELLMKEASNVRFRLESLEESGGAWAEGVWQTVLTGTQTYKNDNMPSGTYWRLRFESTAANWALNLQGFLLFGRVEGSKRT